MTLTELMVPLLLVLAVDFIFAIIYILPGGLPDRIVTQSTADTTYLYITCSTLDPNYGNMIVYFYLGFNILVVLMGLLILLAAMSLKTPHDESIFILFVVSDRFTQLTPCL